MNQAPPASPFLSFWMGGFEGADHLNRHGRPLDMAASSGHLAQLQADHARAAQHGLGTIRESIGWRLAEPAPGRFELGRACRVAHSARHHGLQVVWTFMHYGTPPDVSLLDDAFIDRFVAFATAVARTLGPLTDRPPVYNLINEIGYLAWAVCESNFIHPYRGDPQGRGPRSTISGYSVKRRLVRAVIEAVAAIRRIDPRARFMHVEPLVHVAAPVDRPEFAPMAERIRDYQWQVWDLLGGRLEPGLGGDPATLDLIGVNHYHDGQWEAGTERRLAWHERDPRRRPLGAMLQDAWRRYASPLVVAETSHVGEGRAQWLGEIAREVGTARDSGVPVLGLCLYPLVDRHDWNDVDHWHHSGLWDVAPATRGTVRGAPHVGRVLCEPYAAELAHWQALLPTVRQEGNTMTTLIVFSHLRWGFVFQRPQQLLSRLAVHYRVVFVEEPVRSEGAPRLVASAPAPGVEVLVPHTPIATAGFHDDQLPVLKPLLQEFLRTRGIDDYAVWFYTPMALPLIAQLRPRVVVYDCMDELSDFKDAPRQLRQRDSALSKVADLVFTGGPSLYEARRDHNPATYCLPSSVDTKHFSPSGLDPASEEALKAQRLEAGIARPRLGFFGVIDERFDAALVDALAQAHPEWQLVMVGPVVKIDAAQLPRRPNIHWLGMQAYGVLPHLMAGWDLCLMPFAINDATRFISPTKTLEYMAGEKPIVSTPVRDVISMYGDVVRIAAGPGAFIEACERALGEPDLKRSQRIGEMLSTVFRTSWERNAEVVHQLLKAELRKHPAPRPTRREIAGLASTADPAAQAAAPILNTTARSPRHVDHLVIGAGPTGLAAAHRLRQAEADTLVVEREERVGGWCRSVEVDGFTFDYAGHVMFSADPQVLDLYERLLGDNLHWQNREAWIYSKNVYTRYPFQGSLYGLPPQVLKECLIGAIEARFGPLDGERAVPPPDDAPAHFAEFIQRVWGAGIAKHFATPYNEKLWATPLDRIETSWLGGRVPMPDLGQMIAGAFQPTPTPMGPNARFGYPLRGGFQALMDGFLGLMDCEVACNTGVLQVSPSARTARLDDGRLVHFESLISTMPLTRLVAACGDEAPPEVQRAAGALQHVSVRCVNLGVRLAPGQQRLTDKHWIYYPEDSVFHRIFVQGNASPHNSPAGTCGLTCEISYSPAKPLPCDGQALIDRVIADCRRVGIIGPDHEVVLAHQLDMPCAYVVYDHARADNVALIRQWFSTHGIVLAGRYAEWEYYNSDHAFVAGRNAAQQSLERVGARAIARAG